MKSFLKSFQRETIPTPPRRESIPKLLIKREEEVILKSEEPSHISINYSFQEGKIMILICNNSEVDYDITLISHYSFDDFIKSKLRSVYSDNKNLKIKKPNPELPEGIDRKINDLYDQYLENKILESRVRFVMQEGIKDPGVSKETDHICLVVHSTLPYSSYFEDMTKGVKRMEIGEKKILYQSTFTLEMIESVMIQKHLFYFPIIVIGKSDNSPHSEILLRYGQPQVGHNGEEIIVEETCEYPDTKNIPMITGRKNIGRGEIKY